jgi:hypothetical protein
VFGRGGRTRGVGLRFEGGLGGVVVVVVVVGRDGAREKGDGVVFGGRGFCGEGCQRVRFYLCLRRWDKFLCWRGRDAAGSQNFACGVFMGFSQSFGHD